VGGFGAFGVGQAAQAAQQADLDEVERVDVGVAATDRALQHRVVVEQFAATGDQQQRLARPVEGRFHLAEDEVAHARVLHQPGVQPGDAHVGLGHRHLRIVKQIAEERPVVVHLL